MIIEADAFDGADLPAPRGRFLLGARFAPGPLRTVRRSRPTGAAKGALVGGIVGLAVLAALSLPLVLVQVDGRPVQRQAEAPRSSPVRSAGVAAAMPLSQPLAAETVAATPPVQAASVAPAVASATDAKPARTTLSLDSLPTLTQQASEVDLDQTADLAPPPPRQAQRAPTERRSQPSPARRQEAGR